MNRRTIGLALAVLAFAVRAWAAVPTSWTNAMVLGEGQAIVGSFGWPGISVEYLRSMSNTLDVGGRLTFNYSVEGQPIYFPGVKLAADIKLNVGKLDQFPLLMRFAPGLDFYFATFGTTGIALALPAEAAIAIPINEALLAHASLSLDLALGLWASSFGSTFLFQIPLRAGGGIEWQISPPMSVSGLLRIGPYVGIVPGFLNNANVSFDLLFGLTYRL
jgi:hypothetical protein